MRKVCLAAVIVAVFLATTGIVSANLVTNGGFETPVVGADPQGNHGSWQTYPDGYPGLGWTVERGVGSPDPFGDPAWKGPTVEFQTVNTLGLVPDEGNQYAELDSYGNVKISQVITFDKDKTYSVSFASTCRPQSDPSTLGVYLADTRIAEIRCNAASAQSWVQTSLPVHGIDGPATLTFADEGASNTYGVLLDDVDVEVVGNPVPEFPTALVPVTFVAGFLAIVLFARKHSG